MKQILQKFAATFIIVASLSGLLPAQTGPGGVGGHENDITAGSPINALWLRAHDLQFSDGDFVTMWNDVSGYNHSAVPGIAGKQAILFQQDKVNNKPWVRFFGENYLKVANDEVLDGGEGFGIFVVAKRDLQVANKYEDKSGLVTKRAHWNAWSHVTDISMDAEGLQHAYELRWEPVSGSDGVRHKDTMAITGFMNGNLPDGAGADVFSKKEDTKDIDASYIISHCYSNHEDSYGSFIRINGSQTNRPGRAEGNPNPLRVGPVVQSIKDLWLGGAQYDPPGFSGGENDPCPTCEETNLLEGAMAEVIIYKGNLWHTHVFIIENYLSLKYNIPLVDSVKYYDDDTFVHDLVGIGNEFGDDKKHSSSISHGLTIEEWDESLNAPKEYLFVAHDGLSYEWTTEGLSDEDLQRFGRTWKVEKMGSMDVRFSFNFLMAELNLINSDVPKYKLGYKENPEDDFIVLTDINATRQLRTLHFIVPDDLLKSGYYTVTYGGEPTSIAALDNFSRSLQIFPSPAQNEINLSFANYNTGEITIRFIDLTGREISRVSDYKSEDHFERNISIGHLKQGIYIVEVTVDGKRAVKRMIKQ